MAFRRFGPAFSYTELIVLIGINLGLGYRMAIDPT